MLAFFNRNIKPQNDTLAIMLNTPHIKVIPMSQQSRLLKMLRDAGNKGVPNYAFYQNRILRSSARIGELRAQGYNIYCERQRLNGKATGVFIYYINEEDK